MINRNEVAREKMQRAAEMLQDNNIDMWVFYARLKTDTALELMFNTSVTGNPFTVTFETLDGTIVEGVWNTTAKRIEF